MHRSDQIRVRHMLEAAREAVSFAEGKSRSDLERNRMLLLSIVKCIEIIGEAASSVSEETKAAYPSIPWVDIKAMRNRLIHVYFDVNLDVVWSTVSEDLPALIGEIEKLPLK